MDELLNQLTECQQEIMDKEHQKEKLEKRKECLTKKGKEKNKELEDIKHESERNIERITRDIDSSNNVIRLHEKRKQTEKQTEILYYIAVTTIGALATIGSGFTLLTVAFTLKSVIASLASILILGIGISQLHGTITEKIGKVAERNKMISTEKNHLSLLEHQLRLEEKEKQRTKEVIPALEEYLWELKRKLEEIEQKLEELNLTIGSLKEKEETIEDTIFNQLSENNFGLTELSEIDRTVMYGVLDKGIQKIKK